ncbi:hypothetical protein GCM10009681_17120 [Luedemannella helvata]|uniref:Uncharacterized protein n=2 Tax=Luedemannella helvata TaxID=349315 RepID=A0ABP4W6K7_9ACTN
MGALETMTYPQKPAERPDSQQPSSPVPPTQRSASDEPAFLSDEDSLSYRPPPPYPPTSELPVFKPVALPPPTRREPAAGARNGVLVGVIIGLVVLGCVGLGIAGIFLLSAGGR